MSRTLAFLLALIVALQKDRAAALIVALQKDRVADANEKKIKQLIYKAHPRGKGKTNSSRKGENQLNPLQSWDNSERRTLITYHRQTIQGGSLRNIHTEAGYGFR